MQDVWFYIGINGTMVGVNGQTSEAITVKI